MQGQCSEKFDCEVCSERLTISVVMATYNGSRFLREQMHTIIAELLEGDELVIVDDASNDSTVADLYRFQWPSTHVLRNTKNLGIVKSFERALGSAKGQFVFLCDQDDIWLPGKRYEIVKAFLNDPKVSVVVSDAQLIDESGRVTAKSFMAQRGGFVGGFWSTFHKNRFLGCSMAIRRDVLDIALPIPNRVPMHDMWLGIVGGWVGRVKYISHPLIQYRRHSNNVTTLNRRALSKGLAFRLDLLSVVIPRFLAYKWHNMFKKHLVPHISRP